MAEWLHDGVVTGSDPNGDRILSRMMRRNTKSPFPGLECGVVLVCRRGLWNP
ncbi:hypothetical protein YC2023_057880 [Brassica napus]